jgi:hypothetical protein
MAQSAPLVDSEIVVALAIGRQSRVWRGRIDRFVGERREVRDDVDDAPARARRRRLPLGIVHHGDDDVQLRGTLTGSLKTVAGQRISCWWSSR